MSAEQNMATVRKIFEVINLGDQDRFLQFMDETLAEDYIFHDPGYAGYERGPAGFRKWLVDITRGNTNVEDQYAIDDMIGEGDKVVTRYTFRRKDVTGKEVITWNINIMRFSNGKLAEEWNLFAPMPEGGL